VRVVLASVVLGVLASLVASTSAQQHALLSEVHAARLQPDPSENSADSDAFDEMLRGPAGTERRWARRPSLVVVSSVLQFEGGVRKDYLATAERLSEREVDELVTDLNAGLSLLTSSAFDEFASVRRERAFAGSQVTVMREGQIVVARFRNVRQSLNAVGYGGRTARPDGTIASGTVMLDSEYDRTDGMRRLLRIHELGHALGYNHVKSRRSIMNPTLGSEPTDFDRRAAMVAFRR
jgi:hypothetical protein